MKHEAFTYYKNGEVYASLDEFVGIPDYVEGGDVVPRNGGKKLVKLYGGINQSYEQFDRLLDSADMPVYYDKKQGITIFQNRYNFMPYVVNNRDLTHYNKHLGRAVEEDEGYVVVAGHLVCAGTCGWGNVRDYWGNVVVR